MSKFWTVLNIEPTKDETIIKKAYRVLLPKFHPETDPTGFKALREAYEAALRYAKTEDEPEQINPDAQDDNTQPQVLMRLYEILNDPLQRFMVQTWRDWIFNEVNDLSLDELETVQFHILQTLINQEHLLSHACVRVVIDRFNWQEYYENHSDIESQRIVLNFIETCESDNLFDYSVLAHYPYIVQNRVIIYYATCNGLSRSSTLHYLRGLLESHHAFPMPNDPKLIINIAHWYMLIESPNLSLLESLFNYREILTDACMIKDVDYLINFHQTVYTNHYIQLLSALNPHSHVSTAFQCYQENENFYPFIYLAQFFKNRASRAKHNNHIDFEPLLTVSLPLSVIPKTHLREDVVAMIADYWNDNHNIGFIRSGLIEHPADMIDALLYAVWVIKYGDEWSVENFINIQYTYDHPIANFLLTEFQASARQLLAFFRSSQPIQDAKALLNLYHVKATKSQDIWKDEKEISLLQCWLNRLHPYPESPLEKLMQHGVTIPHKNMVINAYFSYLFLLQENALTNIQAKQKGIDLWRQRQYLLLMFLHLKEINYCVQYESLILKLPKANVTWFDRAFALIKKVRKNEHLHEATFWESFIEQDLKKQPKFANLFYLQHFNCLYIIDRYLPKAATINYIYNMACDLIIYNGIESINDATLLLCHSLLNTKDHLLSVRKKAKIQQFIHYSINGSSESVREAHQIYQQVIDDGEVMTDSSDWIYPYTFILKTVHKTTHKKALHYDELAQLKSIQHSADYPIALCLSARLIVFNQPTFPSPTKDIVIFKRKVPTFLARIIALFSLQGQISRLEYLISLIVLFLPFALYLYSQDPLHFSEVFPHLVMSSSPIYLLSSKAQMLSINFIVLVPLYWGIFATNLRRTRNATNRLIFTMFMVTWFGIMGIIYLLCKKEKN